MPGCRPAYWLWSCLRFAARGQRPAGRHPEDRSDQALPLGNSFPHFRRPKNPDRAGAQWGSGRRRDGYAVTGVP